MSKLSDDLKHAREQRGLSVSDLASRTRISRTSLEALEMGEYGQLPGEVFIVGFIRSYAREVGMDDNEAVKRYKEETGQSAGTLQQDQEAERVTEGAKGLPPREEKPKRSNVTYIVILAVILLLAAAAYYMQSGVGPYPEAQAPALEPAEPETPPAALQETPEPVEEPVTAANMTSVVLETETALVDVPAEPAIILEVEAIAPSWFAYEADEKPYVIRGILQPGRKVVIEADEYVLIDSGNAGGIEITYNGEKLGPLGPSGAVRKNVLYTEDTAGGQGTPRVERPILRQLTSVNASRPLHGVTTGGRDD